MELMKSVIFSVDGRNELLQEIVDYINVGVPDQVSIGEIKTQKFSDNEICVYFETSLRGKRVYLLTSPNTSDEIMKLNFAIDAARRAGAAQIIPIIPYYPYCRSDKKDQIRGTIGAKVFSQMLEERGATSVVTIDLHAEQIEGFFNIPVIHINGKYIFSDFIANEVKLNDGETKLGSTDAGGAKRVKKTRDNVNKKHGINLSMILMDKTRAKANEVESMTIIGDVAGKHIILIDDLCDTAGTLCKGAETIMEAGALSVGAIVTHGVLSGEAYDRISKSPLKYFICSNSLNVRCDDKIKVLSIANQIGKAIIANDLHVSLHHIQEQQ